MNEQQEQPARRRALIVDDDGVTSVLLERALKTAGYVVIGTARNGKQAIEQARLLDPDFIMMDFNMPVVNGTEAMKQIMARHPLPIIMLTASQDDRDREQAVAAGACAFLTKPINKTALLAALEKGFADFDAHHSQTAS